MITECAEIKFKFCITLSYRTNTKKVHHMLKVSSQKTKAELKFS